MNIRNIAAGVILTTAAFSSLLQAQTTVKHIQTEKAAIATGVWAGDIYYLSGTTG